jgi:alkanesulfonate monooxygenase
MALKFHWRLLQGGEGAGTTRISANDSQLTGLPDLEAQVEFCRRAEENGIHGLLTDMGAAKPDSIILATALGLATERIEFIIAYRSGLLSPTLFVQQLNTLSSFINGRLSLNIVAGYSPQQQRYYGDLLSHDERYARTEEFLAVCLALWSGKGGVNFSGKYYTVENARLNTPYISPDRRFPEIFIGGGSTAARDLAIKYGTCWMRLADAPENIRADIAPVLEVGKEVGLRMSIIARPTREAAVRAAYSLIQNLERDKKAENAFVQTTDSVSIKKTYEMAATEWLTTYLWTGAVRSHGAPAVALVGTPEEIASALIDYKKVGVSQFILSGWPKLDEMIYFGKEILPLVRKMEHELESGLPSANIPTTP